MTDFFREFMEQFGAGRADVPRASRRVVLMGRRHRSTSERLVETFLAMRPGERAVVLSSNPEYVERLFVAKVARARGIEFDVLRPEELRPKASRAPCAVLDESLFGTIRAGRQGSRSSHWHAVALREAMRGRDPEAERAKYEALPIWRKNDPGAAQ